jgi:hypothetical protein
VLVGWHDCTIEAMALRLLVRVHVHVARRGQDISGERGRSGVTAYVVSEHTKRGWNKNGTRMEGTDGGHTCPYRTEVSECGVT